MAEFRSNSANEFSSIPSTRSPFEVADTPAMAEEEIRGKHLLTVHEVAELLRVPVSWVYSRTRKRSVGRLPGYHLGKYWRFREDEVLAWLKSQASCARSM